MQTNLQGKWSEFLALQYFFIQRNEAANRVRGPCEEEQLEAEGCLLS